MSITTSYYFQEGALAKLAYLAQSGYGKVKEMVDENVMTVYTTLSKNSGVTCLNLL